MPECREAFSEEQAVHYFFFFKPSVVSTIKVGYDRSFKKREKRRKELETH